MRTIQYILPSISSFCGDEQHFLSKVLHSWFECSYYSEIAINATRFNILISEIWFSDSVFILYFLHACKLFSFLFLLKEYLLIFCFLHYHRIPWHPSFFPSDRIISFDKWHFFKRRKKTHNQTAQLTGTLTVLEHAMCNTYGPATSMKE